MIRRLIAVAALVTALCAGVAAPAFADGSADPTDCTNVTPGTTADCPDFTTPSGDPNPFAWFVPLMVIVVAVGIGTTVWRVRTARALAEDAGLDPDRAAAVTLLSDNGLDAAYVASAVRRSDAPPSRMRPLPLPRDNAERLRELDSLRHEGLVTEEEYQARRSAIIASL